MPTTTPGPSNHHQTFHDESSQSAAPLHTNLDVALGMSSASALGIIPTTSLATDKQQFSPQCIGRPKALMLKENRTQPSSRSEQRRLPFASLICTRIPG